MSYQVNQPQPGSYHPNMAQPSSGEWKHGLCECACPDCACVLLGCGNCYAGMTAHAAGKGPIMSFLYCLCPILLCCLRCEVRESHGINGNNCQDAVCMYFCGPCAIVQTKKQISDDDLC